MQLNEKAKSAAQQKFMGMVHAAQDSPSKLKKASPAVKKAAKGMTKKAASEFASTKHKGLPDHVDESLSLRLDRALFEDEQEPKEVKKPKCIACDDTGKNSKGGVCHSCMLKK